MSDVYIRTQKYLPKSNIVNDINRGSYDVKEPSNAVLCSTITDFENSTVMEVYCHSLNRHQFVILHTKGQILEFCEIQVNDYTGKYHLASTSKAIMVTFLQGPVIMVHPLVTWACSWCLILVFLIVHPN